MSHLQQFGDFIFEKAISAPRFEETDERKACWRGDGEIKEGELGRLGGDGERE